jgi:hypothetical protein
VLTCWSFGWLFGVLREGMVGGGAGAVRAGGRGAKAPAPGEGLGVGVGTGLAVCASARGAAIRSATSAAMASGALILAYPGGGVPPEPELGRCPGGETPPLLGLPLPDEPPPVPPLEGVPEPGVCVPEDGGATVPPEGADDEGVPELGVPPPEPPIGTPPPEFFAFLFFLVSPGCTGLPPVTGGAIGWIVWLEPDPPPPPPLDAIAIRTIRKNATAASATSRRRR